MSAPTIWTIGYEAAGFGAFLATLQAAGITMVIDVRDLPLSRRAGFSKRILAASLATAGVGYTHLKNLGTPKEGRVALRSGDKARFWAIFEERLARPEAAVDLQRAVHIAREQPSALLCYEADPRQCHRRRVADAMAAEYDFAVCHLTVAGP